MGSTLYLPSGKGGRKQFGGRFLGRIRRPCRAGKTDKNGKKTGKARESHDRETHHFLLIRPQRGRKSFVTRGKTAGSEDRRQVTRGWGPTLHVRAIHRTET